MRGNIIKKRKITFAFEKIPRISLSCKVVPDQNREYENGIFTRGQNVDKALCTEMIQASAEWGSSSAKNLENDGEDCSLKFEKNCLIFGLSFFMLSFSGKRIKFSLTGREQIQTL